MKKKNIEKISKIFNFEEDTQILSVYLTLLNIGSGTLGQISSIVGLDYITTSNKLDELNLRGYVKKIGKIPRYYCLEPFLDSFVNSIDNASNKAIIDMFLKRIETSSLTPIDNKEMFEEYINKTLTEKKKELVNNFDFNDNIANKEVLNDFLSHSVQTISNTAFELIKDAEKNGKKLLTDILKNDFQSLFHLVEEIYNKVKLIHESSREIETLDKEIPADILFGESSVLSMMKDLILRAKSTLIILMPKPELQSIILISEKILSKSVKVTITGNLEKVPKTMLKRLKPDTSTGSVQLRQSSEINSWAIIKDNEEILFAPDVSGKDLMVGIWIQASVEGLEQLIHQFSTQIHTMASRAHNIQI